MYIIAIILVFILLKETTKIFIGAYNLLVNDINNMQIKCQLTKLINNVEIGQIIDKVENEINECGYTIDLFKTSKGRQDEITIKNSGGRKGCKTRFEAYIETGDLVGVAKLIRAIR